MRQFAKFQRYWGDLGAQIHKLVNARSGARLYLPNVSHPVKLDNGRSRVSFERPAFFYNAPQKSASRRDKRGRQAIFIDGVFDVEDVEGGTQLAWTACSMCVFATEDAPDTYRLRLTDSIHFDAEAEPANAFHPQFHVQRGRSLKMTPAVVRDCVRQTLRLETSTIEIVDDIELGCPQLRLPTPPMDYINVLTTVAADFFCRADDDDKAPSSTMDGFRELLRFVLDRRNVMHDGVQARLLRHRWSDDPAKFAMARWYAESVY